MYLLPDQCANCGKSLDGSAKHAPHNVEFARKANVSLPPQFCSPSCMRKAVEEYVNKDIIESVHGLTQWDAKLHEAKKRSVKAEFDAEIEEIEREQKALFDQKGEYPKRFMERYPKLTERWKEVQARKNEADKQLFDESMALMTEGPAKVVEAEKRQYEFARTQYVTDYFSARAIHISHNLPKPAPAITDDIRFEHALCLAASGGGKTTFMLHDILENLKRPEPPSMVVIDPKGTVLKQISQLAIFDPVNGKHKDRLIIIDPSDIRGPPAFNVFKPANEERYERYDESTKEFLETQVIDLLSYTFSSRSQPLTGRQGPCFENVCRLVTRLKDRDLSTILDILGDQDGQRHQSLDKTRPEWLEAIYQLPDLGVRFFEQQYYSNYASTRDEVATRLYGLISHPAIQRVFSASHNRFDIFEALQTGKLVIVNVPIAYLGDKGTELFGRYMIASTLAAALERVTLPRERYRPAFIYIDECQLFADDDKTVKLLNLAREFSLGVYLFTQLLDNFSNKMQSVVLTNTRTKYAARLTSDAGMMARAMGNCDEKYVRVAPDNEKKLVQLACYVDGLMETPAIIQLPMGAIDKEPKMSKEHYELLLTKNRQAVSSPPRAPRPRTAQQQPTPEPPAPVVAPKAPIMPRAAQLAVKPVEPTKTVTPPTTLPDIGEASDY